MSPVAPGRDMTVADVPVGEGLLRRFETSFLDQIIDEEEAKMDDAIRTQRDIINFPHPNPEETGPPDDTEPTSQRPAA